MEELKSLLDEVSDSYPAFVGGVLDMAEDCGVIDEMIEYVKNHAEADSSDITGYLIDIAKLEPAGIEEDDE